MSLQSAEQFTSAVALNPTLSAEVTGVASSKSIDEAAIDIAAIGKREGFDFTPEEAAVTRQALTDSELDQVAGGDGGYVQTAVGTAAGGLLGQAGPGVGGILGAGVGAGVSTALGGGSANESIAAGATSAAQNMQQGQSAVQQFFSTKW